MMPLSVIFLILFLIPPGAAASDMEPFSPSESAAQRCRLKLQEIEKFSETQEPEGTKTTRFTDVELSSHILLDAASKHRPCLKNFKLGLMDGFLAGNADVDFDCLKSTSAKSFPKLVARLFSGTYAITIRGILNAADGKGSFRLDEFTLDGKTIPNILVEELISALCKDIKPPLDPMQPSPLPYKIRSITIRPGYIIVRQHQKNIDTGRKQSETFRNGMESFQYFFRGNPAWTQNNSMQN